MQQIPLQGPEPVDRLKIVVNGLTYYPNRTPGLTFTTGQDHFKWDETVLFTLISADLIIQEHR